jgi:hypothetical protein
LSVDQLLVDQLPWSQKFAQSSHPGQEQCFFSGLLWARVRNKISKNTFWAKAAIFFSMTFA